MEKSNMFKIGGSNLRSNSAAFGKRQDEMASFPATTRNRWLEVSAVLLTNAFLPFWGMWKRCKWQSGEFVKNCYISGQIIIFHQPRFPWNKGISLSQLPFGVRSCEVAILWPDIYPPPKLTSRHPPLPKTTLNHGKLLNHWGSSVDPRIPHSSGAIWSKWWVDVTSNQPSTISSLKNTWNQRKTEQREVANTMSWVCNILYV